MVILKHKIIKKNERSYGILTRLWLERIIRSRSSY